LHIFYGRSSISPTNVPQSPQRIAVFRLDITVPPQVVDGNRHVNNVAYVQWMQDVALAHSAASGCTALTRELGATWVARTHHIEYLSPAFAHDQIGVLTWVADFRKVRSLRRYRFVRAADQRVLAQGETEWVFVDAVSGRPRAIPPEIKSAFVILPDGPEGNPKAEIRNPKESRSPNSEL
jgi:acyl-CoA thioester hydrolase